MTYDKAPVPADLAQWPEARGFQRIYARNPEYQARLVMALFGLREDLLEWAHDEPAAEAVAEVIRAFRRRHPEFMQDGYVIERDLGTNVYHVDDRLLTYMAEIATSERK